MASIERERLFLRAAVAMAPAEYRLLTDGGDFATRDAPLLERCYALREHIVGRALETDATRAELGCVLLELAAAIHHSGMTRETFVKNAELWYDSAKLAAPNAVHNAPGTKGTTS